MAETCLFSKLCDDVILSIFFKLEEDPRHWARIACVSPKFSSLIRQICWKHKCYRTIPSVASDLLYGTPPPGGWAPLFKVAVCCPGLLHSGVLVENSVFLVEQELRFDENHPKLEEMEIDTNRKEHRMELDSDLVAQTQSKKNGRSDPPEPDSAWSHFDYLHHGTLHNVPRAREGLETGGGELDERIEVAFSDGKKKRKSYRCSRSHLASGSWNLSREQGNKLLASRFRGDSLYICDWPGCVHLEEKRNYMIFRGFFTNFKQSRVWGTISNGNRSRITFDCAFCACKQTWDLHSAFCLRRGLGYHEDGEPFVRAYVCENGHVSGAWTDWPLYT